MPNYSGVWTLSRQFKAVADGNWPVNEPFYGLFAGGISSTNVIDYITISTTGNATDFGGLSAPVFGAAACSSAHGGL